MTTSSNRFINQNLLSRLLSLAPICLLLISISCSKNDTVVPEPQEANKKLVSSFYSEVFVKKNLANIDDYIGDTYLQHNPFLPDGKEALKDFLENWFSNSPSLQIKIERVVAEGNLVILHVSSQESSNARQTAISDIFRVESGKIVEHWDVIQSVPSNPVHANGMFAGSDNSTPVKSNLEANKQIVLQLYKSVFNDKDLSLIDQYLAEDYRQHNPTVADGKKGFRQFVSYLAATYPEMSVEVKRVIAENNFVVLHVHAKFTPEDSGLAITDYYRMQDGKIVEHWDVIQAVVIDPANDNTMF